MSKLKEVSTAEVLYGTKFGATNLPEGGKQVGCYTKNLGQLMEDEFPTLPINNEGQIVLSWALAKRLINRIVSDLKNATDKCSNKRLVIKKPTGIFSFIPMLAVLAGLDIFD